MLAWFDGAVGGRNGNTTIGLRRWWGFWHVQL
jgi:hypothetical protein